MITLSPVRGLARTRKTVVLTGHGADVTDANVVGVPGGSVTLVSSSVDGTVRLWDLAAAATQASTGGTPSDTSAVLAATSIQQDRPIGLVIAAAPDKKVAIVDLGSGEPLTHLMNVSGVALGGTCGWIPGIGHAAVIFDTGGFAAIWMLPAGGLVNLFRTYFGAIRTQADRLPVQTTYVALADRPLVITCGHGSKAIVWDLVGRRIHDVFDGHTGPVTALASGTSHDGTPVAATGGQDNKVRIWDVVRGRRIDRLRLARRLTYLHRRDSGCARAVSLALSEERRFVVLVLCEDGCLRIFRQKGGWPRYQRAVVDTRGASGLAVITLADGRLVAVTGGADGRLCAWDIKVALTGAQGRHTWGQRNKAPLLLSIETEVSVTGLTVAADDTVVASTLTGLAAFRFDMELLGHGNLR